MQTMKILDTARRYTFTTMGTVATVTSTDDLTDTARRKVTDIFVRWQTRSGGTQEVLPDPLAKAMAVSEACEILDDEQPEGWRLFVGSLEVTGGAAYLRQELVVAA